MKTIKEKLLVGAMYAPFCRTKYVDTSEWENDIRKMSELGFTCLHGFSEWWRVEKQKGVFDFSEQDLLVELCHKYGITPIINVATQNGVGYYMPRWMQNEYKGRGTVTADGESNSDSEYVGACLDDPWYMAYAERYLRALATHFAGDDRLGGWVIWGEPSQTRDSKPICYCEHTVKRFQAWLKKRYGTIEKLNETWGSEGPHDHTDFCEVRPPVGFYAQRGGFASWPDWQRFMCENFAEHIKRVDSIFKECGAMQPTITELTCRVKAGAHCNDLWLLAETSDIVGVSQYNRPGFDTEIAMTVAESIAAKLHKSVFVVEALGGGRYPTADNRTPGPLELTAEAVQMVGMGAKGLMYWCWRPRLTDYESGRYGMCRADGKPLPRTYEMGRTASRFGELSDLLFGAKRPAQVAILNSTRLAYAAACASVNETLQDAVTGALRLCSDAHIPAIFVDDDMLQAGLPDEIKALILPFAYALDEEALAGIAKFTERGGTVIADRHLAFTHQNGYIYRELPGGGMRDVFGLEVDDWVYMDHPAAVPENKYGMTVGTLYDILLPTSATVEETCADLPFITRNSFGKGEAWYFAWDAFGCYLRNGGVQALRDRVTRILADRGILPFMSIENRSGAPDRSVSSSMLELADGRRAITIVNASYEPAELKTLIPGAGKVTALIGNAEVIAKRGKGGTEADISLHPWGSVILLAEK